MSADPARGPHRGVHRPSVLERPGAWHGQASAVAVGGMGRLRCLARASAPRLVPPGPYGSVAALETGTTSPQRGGAS
jgi:hypothetical protein